MMVLMPVRRFNSEPLASEERRTMARGQIPTPRKPRVGMSGFAEYLSAGTSRRINCVRQQIETYAEPYRPGAAFYKDFAAAQVLSECRREVSTFHATI